MTTNGTSMARTARLKQLSATLHGFGGSPVWVFECRARRSGAGVRGRPVEARTDDRDAGEDRYALGFDQLRQFMVASVLEAVDRDRSVRRRPALSGCAGRC